MLTLSEKFGLVVSEVELIGNNAAYNIDDELMPGVFEYADWELINSSEEYLKVNSLFLNVEENDKLWFMISEDDNENLDYQIHFEDDIYETITILKTDNEGNIYHERLSDKEVIKLLLKTYNLTLDFSVQ